VLGTGLTDVFGNLLDSDANGVARRLRLESTTPGRSVLTGRAKHLLPGSNGHTFLPTITGAGGRPDQAETVQFTLGLLSTEAVDAVLHSGSLTRRKRH
jgi:hypothetical protein